MTIEFRILENRRLSVAQRIKQLLPQEAGQDKISADQWDAAGNTSSEPDDKTYKLILENSEDNEVE